VPSGRFRSKTAIRKGSFSFVSLNEDRPVILRFSTVSPNSGVEANFDRIAGFHSSRDNRAANDLVNLIPQRRNPIDDRVCKQRRERVIGCHKRSLFHLAWDTCYSNITVREY
jgi:hypothetical protein